MDKELTGKIALVTGSGRGLGRLMAERLAALGADIVLRSGLDESFGFVINPGRNILGDIFGVRAKRVPCRLV